MKQWYALYVLLCSYGPQQKQLFLSRNILSHGQTHHCTHSGCFTLIPLSRTFVPMYLHICHDIIIPHFYLPYFHVPNSVLFVYFVLQNTLLLSFHIDVDTFYREVGHAIKVSCFESFLIQANPEIPWITLYFVWYGNDKSRTYIIYKTHKRQHIKGCQFWIIWGGDREILWTHCIRRADEVH